LEYLHAGPLQPCYATTVSVAVSAPWNASLTSGIRPVTNYKLDARGFRLGVEVGELFDVELSVAVLVELGEQNADTRRREAVRRTLKDARRLVQRDVAVLVMIILLELGYQLHLPACQRFADIRFSNPDSDASFMCVS